jgi:hypothetical protein
VWDIGEVGMSAWMRADVVLLRAYIGMTPTNLSSCYLPSLVLFPASYEVTVLKAQHTYSACKTIGFWLMSWRVRCLHGAGG